MGYADQRSVRALVSGGGLVDAVPAHLTASQVLAQLCVNMAGRVADLEESRRSAVSIHADLAAVSKALAVAKRHLAGLEALRLDKTLLSEERFDVFADVTHRPWMVINVCAAPMVQGLFIWGRPTPKKASCL